MSDNSDNELEEKSEIELLREKNLRERNALLQTLKDNPLFVEAAKDVKVFNGTKTTETQVLPKNTKRRKRGDGNFRFFGTIPVERRKSARLKKEAPSYTHLDLPNEKENVRDADSLSDLEDVVFPVKRSKTTRSPRASSPPKISVEEVTEEMIKNIQTSGLKVYGPGGTSCHQCRQKTVDTKTICRSGFCVGVRGQFCGICVINRYGEDPAKALKDPNWQCYVCRGCCNCSFCRAKEGKRPTGILTPMARTAGYNSVHDFLKSLNGHGD